MFEEPPVFAPLRAAPEEGGEECAPGGRRTDCELAGTYFQTPAASRTGVIVFCPEFLGDRWSALPYTEGLREAGFNLSAFDFRNHGESDSDPSYEPLQWVSDLELIDLQAALDYVHYLLGPTATRLASGLFGISRGGGTALCVAADDPTVWGVVTTTLPTHGTMLAS